MGFKTFLIVIILILAAFGAGYGLGYWKLQMVEKEWTAARGEMESKIRSLGKELAQVKARESLREMSDGLSQAITHLSEKNFGLAVKTLEGLKENFSAIQSTLGKGIKGQFDFFPPALEEAKKEAESLSPNAQKKLEELKQLFEQALRPVKKD